MDVVNKGEFIDVSKEQDQSSIPKPDAKSSIREISLSQEIKRALRYEGSAFDVAPTIRISP